MSDEEWWAAKRRAAEFWRKLKENQSREHHYGRGSGNDSGASAAGSRSLAAERALAAWRD